MLHKLVIFNHVSDFIRELIPEEMTLEQLEEEVASLQNEIDDMKQQVKLREIQAKLNQEQDSTYYLEWLERITARLRIKNNVYGILKYNLERIKKSDILSKCDDLNNKINSLVDAVSKIKKGIVYQNEQVIPALKRENERLSKNNTKIIEQWEFERRFILRALYALANDSKDHQFINDALHYIPEQVEKNPDYGSKLRK